MRMNRELKYCAASSHTCYTNDPVLRCCVQCFTGLWNTKIYKTYTECRLVARPITSLALHRHTCSIRPVYLPTDFFARRPFGVLDDNIFFITSLQPFFFPSNYFKIWPQFYEPALMQPFWQCLAEVLPRHSNFSEFSLSTLVCTRALWENVWAFCQSVKLLDAFVCPLLWKLPPHSMRERRQ
jgi:hypothetical protein